MELIETHPMTNGNLTHWTNNHMSCWQEVKNCRDVCGNTKSFNLPYKRRKRGVWFTSQHYHPRIQQITAEILECNGACLSLTTLHSLFPLLLFFSLCTSFLSSQRLCRKCTLEFIFESDKRNACHFLFVPSPYGHMKKCTDLMEGFSTIQESGCHYKLQY